MKKRYGWETKSLNENLNPLRNFLMSRRGQLWDNVYSELREHLRIDKAIDLHIMQHLWHYVERHVIDKDGVLYVRTAYFGDRPLEGRGTLYVHPKTKTLEYAKATKRERPEKPVTSFHMGGNEWLILHNDCWFVCQMEEVPKTIRAQVYDYTKQAWTMGYIKGYATNSLTKTKSSYPGTYISKHRSASSKEIKRYVLENNS